MLHSFDELDRMGAAPDDEYTEPRRKKADKPPIDYTKALDCPICGALNCFLIHPGDEGAGTCCAEMKIWRIQPGPNAPKPPRIICLCGSTRFAWAFEKANAEETLAGNIVLSVGFFMHATPNANITDEQKRALDELHKRKIDLADEVLILNVNGYIGDSTRSEIEYAESHGKTLRYLERV